MARILDDVGKALSLLKKPQSMASGFGAGLMKMFSDQYDPEDRFKFNDPISGLLAGAKEDYSPTGTVDWLEGKYDAPKSGLAKAIGMGVDVGADPLFLAGPALKSLGLTKNIGALTKLGEGAGKIGHIPRAEGLQAGKRLGQLGRRAAVGATAGAEGPEGILGAIGLQAVGERGLAAAAKTEAAQRVLTRFGGKAAGGAAKKIAGVADEKISGATPENPMSPGAVVTPEDLGEDLGRTIRVSGGGPLAEGDEATAAGVAKLQALTGSKSEGVRGVTMSQALGKTRPKARVPKATPEPLIGEAPTPNRGPLIGEPEPAPEILDQLKQSVAKNQARKASMMAEPTPQMPGAGVPATTPQIAPMPQTPMSQPQPMATQQPMMNVPQTPPTMGGPVQTTAPGAMPPAPQPQGLVPDFLRQKVSQPQLGTPPMNADVANLQSNPAIAQILNDPTLTEDKKLEMLLRGLGAI